MTDDETTIADALLALGVSTAESDVDGNPLSVADGLLEVARAISALAREVRFIRLQEAAERPNAPSAPNPGGEAPKPTESEPGALDCVPSNNGVHS